MVSYHRDDDRFNGATAKQLWKRPCSDAATIDRLASMGPQPNSCGNTSPAGISCRPPVRFNGATAKQLWKRGIADCEDAARYASMGPQPNSCGNFEPETPAPPPQLRFNGATAKQLWKRPLGRQPVARTSRLQWGHSQTAVETNDILVEPVKIHVASMGPQPNSCGNTTIPAAQDGRHHASMGPQPNSCGNLTR